MNTLLIMDIVILGFGIYMLYVCVHMKKTKKVHSVLLAEEELKKCKNQKGFVDYITPKMIAFACISLIDAVIGIVGELLVHNVYLNYAYMIIFFAAFLWFGSCLKKAREKYCKPF